MKRLNTVKRKKPEAISWDKDQSFNQFTSEIPVAAIGICPV
jgi:hypothetical protein